jgi:hypothetical protein
MVFPEILIDKNLVFAYTDYKISRNAGWGWSKDPGPSRAGMFPASFFEVEKRYERTQYFY